MLGLTLGEIHGLVRIAADCNGGDFFPRLEEVLDHKLRETRQEISRLSALRDNLLYYRSRLLEVGTPRECDRNPRKHQEGSCGCLEAVTTAAYDPPGTQKTTEEVKKMKILEENGRLIAARQPCCEECGCECCDTEQCECC